MKAYYKIQNFAQACQCLGTHVLEEAASDTEGLTQAQFQFRQEVVLVEVAQLLQVAKDGAALATQVLRHVAALQLGEVVLRHVAERSHVLPLRHQKLLHDTLQLPAVQKQKHLRHGGLTV